MDGTANNGSQIKGVPSDREILRLSDHCKHPTNYILVLSIRLPIFAKKSEDMNYQKFREGYEASGLTQRAYGIKVGKSASMVHYYLRRARQEAE